MPQTLERGREIGRTGLRVPPLAFGTSGIMATKMSSRTPSPPGAWLISAAENEARLALVATSAKRDTTQSSTTTSSGRASTRSSYSCQGLLMPRFWPQQDEQMP